MDFTLTQPRFYDCGMAYIDMFDRVVELFGDDELSLKVHLHYFDSTLPLNALTKGNA
jgi:hypothetical protein